MARNAGYFADVRVRYSSDMRCVLGLDGGGTKTDCVLMDGTGAVLARTRSGPSNPAVVGAEVCVAVLVKAAERALEISGKNLADVAIFSGGVAGMGSGSGFPEVIAALRAKFPGAHVSLLSDLSLALAATGETPSVVAIAGTGSAILGRNAKGETARQGGLGFTLGDVGSAYEIGRRAVVGEARRVNDGEGPSVLRERILEQFRCSWTEFLGKVRTRSVEILPQTFPLVVRGADEGDERCGELLRKAGGELGRLGARVILRLGLGEEEFFFAKTGGVFGVEVGEQKSKATASEGGRCKFNFAFDAEVVSAAPRVRLGGLPEGVAEFAARTAVAGLRSLATPTGS
jgi:N-acetylglucosamine kinase-like BadF-type ATPase